VQTAKHAGFRRINASSWIGFSDMVGSLSIVVCCHERPVSRWRGVVRGVRCVFWNGVAQRSVVRFVPNYVITTRISTKLNSRT
jgi:hypothetical protein